MSVSFSATKMIHVKHATAQEDVHAVVPVIACFIRTRKRGGFSYVYCFHYCAVMVAFIITSICVTLFGCNYLAYRHFGPRTLRTQGTSAPADWCRSVRTFRHQFPNVHETSALVPNCLDIYETLLRYAIYFY